MALACQGATPSHPHGGHPVPGRAWGQTPPPRCATHTSPQVMWTPTPPEATIVYTNDLRSSVRWCFIRRKGLTVRLPWRFLQAAGRGSALGWQWEGGAGHSQAPGTQARGGGAVPRTTTRGAAFRKNRAYARRGRVRGRTSVRALGPFCASLPTKPAFNDHLRARRQL